MKFHALLVVSLFFLSSLSGIALAQSKKGEEVYQSSCASCHAKGTAGAPVTGDSEAWKPVLKQGMEHLYQAAINGKGAMPPKGGNSSLSEAEVKAAVDFMVDQSQ